MFLITLLNAEPYLILPGDWVGYLMWLALAGLLLWQLWASKTGLGETLGARRGWFMVLIFFGILAASLFGYRPSTNVLPMPGMPFESQAPVLLFFFAIPYVLAGGMFGPVAGVVVGLISGVILGVWETHNPFTILEIGWLAWVFSALNFQTYRTKFFKWMRNPLVAAISAMAFVTPFLIVSTLFATNGSLAVRLDYALNQSWLTVLMRAIELTLAGGFAQVVVMTGRARWGKQGAPIPAPYETSLQQRFLYSTVPLVVVVMFVLFLCTWIVAGQTAESMVESRLKATAKVAAGSFPYFLETGQNLALALADESLMALTPAEATDRLSVGLRSVPFFRQLSLLDIQGNSIGGYPTADFDQLLPTREERTGINLALKGVLVQSYTVPPLTGEPSAQVSFIAAIRNASGETVGVLVGRTDLSTNPFTQPAIRALEPTEEEGVGDQSREVGEGLVLGENNVILYHPNSSQVMQTYLGKTPSEEGFYTDSSPTGTRQMVYYQPVIGKPWAIVLTVPASFTQEQALKIAGPFFGMLIGLSLALSGLVFIVLGSITKSMRTLTVEAGYITQGNLERALQTTEMDEVGQLSRSFEQMRRSLKDRMEELNRLLRVSQGVAANLEISKAVQPILDAARLNSVRSARIVLVENVTLNPGHQRIVSFASGPDANHYAYLDEQLFDALRQQEVLTLNNVGRMRRLHAPAGKLLPAALVAISIRHESEYYGAFWAAYDQPVNFTEEDLRFMRTLAGEAALAAANARLYATAEVGRQRLQAVLASTSEPVLVTDEQDQLLLVNQAARQVPGLLLEATGGLMVRQVVGKPDLADVLVASNQELSSTLEITFENQRTYYASISAVMAEGRPVGKVCILRDITHFKELDELKSDFVATVSHDLRSPLTLIRGYISMLQMIGELNEQQKAYVARTLNSVEGMARLINNLLDLGRIATGVGLKVEDVSSAEMVETVVNAQQPHASQRNQQIELHLPPNGAPALRADRALLTQALLNLVENAVKYSPMGGKIEVTVEKRNSNVAFIVQDHGIGIAPIDLPRLFEKFYRSGRREAHQQRGTGLGLAIVKSIAERHGGRVWVESQLGRGSTFTFEIPAEPRVANDRN